jgi:hypothetical protein
VKAEMSYIIRDTTTNRTAFFDSSSPHNYPLVYNYPTTKIERNIPKLKEPGKN